MNDPAHNPQGFSMYRIQKLLQAARNAGAHDAGFLNTGEILVDESLVGHCSSCPSFGSSGHCPPNTVSVKEFKLSLSWYRAVIVFKRDLPMADLISENRIPESRKIHDMATQMEKAVRQSGFPLAWGVATGGCREIFCSAFDTCRILDEKKACRFEGQAKVSMSALGINFTTIAEKLNWEMIDFSGNYREDTSKKGFLAGMVFMG